MSHPNPLHRGAEFLHDEWAQPGWKPSDDQTEADRPKARMKIGHVRGGQVRYGFADQTDAPYMMMSRQFTGRFANTLTPAPPYTPSTTDRKDA